MGYLTASSGKEHKLQGAETQYSTFTSLEEEAASLAAHIRLMSTDGLTNLEI